MRMYLSYNGSSSNISNIFDIRYGIIKNSSFIFMDNASSNKKEIGKIIYNGPYDIYTSIENSGNWFKFDDVSFNLHPDVSFSTQILDGYIKDISLVIQYKEKESGKEPFTDDIEFIERITPDGDNTYFETDGIGEPTLISKDISYIPFTCLGLPILGLSSGYPLIDICFDNQSTRYLVENSNITVEFGVSPENSFVKYTDTSYLNYNDVVKGTLSGNSNIVWNNQLIDIDFSANSNATGTTSPKNLQFRYKFKNIYGESPWKVDPSLFIWDKKTLDLIDTIDDQSTNTVHIEVPSGGATGNAKDGVVEMNVLKVPDNFHPTDKNQFTAEILDVTSATVVDRNRLIIYDGKFCSAAYFKEQFGTSSDKYNSNVKVFDDQETDAINGGPFYGPGGSTTDTLKNDFRWQIFSMRYKNTSGNGVPIGICVISLGSSTSTNITENHLKKFSNGSTYSYQADSTSDVEIWIKYIRSAGDSLPKEESRWNKLIQNNTNYIGASHGAINQPWNGNDSSKSRTSSWIGGELTGVITI